MSKKVDVPPELPALLKNYTKAVIRTQPEDLLKWYETNRAFLTSYKIYMCYTEPRRSTLLFIKDSYG